MFSLVVLSGNPKRAPNQFLAFFLLLIAGNQFAEVARSLAAFGYSKYFWFKIAAVCAGLDPFILYYFGSIYPERNSLNDLWKVGLVGAGSLFFTVAALFRAPTPHSLLTGSLHLGWATFTAITYTAVLLHVGRQVIPEIQRPEVGYLFPAFAVVTIPAVTRVEAPLTRWLNLGGLLEAAPRDAWSVGILWFGASLVIFLGLAAEMLRRREPPSTRARRLFLGSLGVAFALAAFFSASDLTSAWQAVGLPGNFLGRIPWGPWVFATAIRWLIFSLLVSTAVLRYELLGLSLRARRRAARVLVGLGFVAGAWGLLAATQALTATGGFTFETVDLLVLGLALLASQRFTTLLDRVGEKVYGVPPAGDRDSHLDAYRSAVERVVAAGRSPREDEDLERLREELGLGEATARTLEQMAASADAEPLDRGRTIAGRYRVSRLLGSGGTGRAFLAHDTLLDREVVLKEIQGQGDARERALEEARLASKEHHPNVLTVFDVIERPDAAILVTEYAAGGSLAEAVDQEGRLDLERGLELLDGVLAALAAVHERGIVHRDVKPGNILLGSDGQPRLADFGVARLRRGVTTTQEVADVLVGTPVFMAPEQRRGERAREPADIYAVGRLMEACLKHPLPDEVEAVKDRALAEDPSRRWSSAEEMRTVLREVIGRLDLPSDGPHLGP